MNNHSTPYICSPEGEISTEGAVAQSVEQRTENPCVAGSIPAHTTTKTSTAMLGFFVILILNEQKDIFIVYSSFYCVLYNPKCKLLGNSKT